MKLVSEVNCSKSGNICLICSRSSLKQDLLIHINVSMVSFLQSLLLLFYFCIFLSQLYELVWKLAEKISLQSASKRFPSFGPPANGNKSNAKKSRFRPNRNLTGTICHWSIILGSFSVILNSAKRGANVALSSGTGNGPPIPVADQKDRGLWERDWFSAR